MAGKFKRLAQDWIHHQTFRHPTELRRAGSQPNPPVQWPPADKPASLSGSWVNRNITDNLTSRTALIAVMWPDEKPDKGSAELEFL
jgi:hypothetical protein